MAQHHISKYELKWAIFHPYAALKVKYQLPKAMSIYKEVKQLNLLDSLEFGGKLDAFRHSFTMAYLVQGMKTKKLRRLGIAHEKGNKHQFKKHQQEFGERADSLACEMDLRNNELGFLIGKKHPTSSIQELKQLVIFEINNGNAWYLKRNPQNKYVSCSNEIIDMSTYDRIWSIPKCLIKSNE